jgi:hypothetical protein
MGRAQNSAKFQNFFCFERGGGGGEDKQLGEKWSKQPK